MISIKENNENYTLVEFNEDIDKLIITNADQVKKELNKIVDSENTNVIIDFSRVSFIDSTGFGSLVTVYNHAKNTQTNLLFCNISSQTQMLLKITKLDQVFDIYPDLESAINQVK